MAYREKVFNANVLTDLLSTYLTHRAGEREKYYEAEQKMNKPQYRTVDGNLVEIGRGGQMRTLMSKKQEEKEPKFEDFTKDGIIYKGQFMGKDYTQTPEDIEVGMPKSYQYTGFSDTRFKPEDKDKRKKEIENKDIQRMVAERKTLIKRKNKNYDIEDLIMIEKGIIPKDFTNTDQEQLDYIEQKLVEKGFDIYGQEKKLDSSSASKVKKGDDSKLLQDLKNEFPDVGGGNDPPTEKDAKYYFSKKGKSDFKKIVEEFEQKYPPGTYDPLKVDMEQTRFWFELEQKYLPKNLDSHLGMTYKMQYNFDIARKFGRDGTINNPDTSKTIKGSFWE
tara:strand:- start:1092 stop:2090 length:999 start_codon:yes stop_codon:yes gene_type:complete